MSKKQLNEEALGNELSASAFFQPAPVTPLPRPAIPSSTAETSDPPKSEEPLSLTDEQLGNLGTLEPSAQNSLLVGKEGNREVGKEASQPEKREIGKLFDLSDKPSRKDSFLFTDEEFEKMDDIKLDLRRTHDLKATKNDLARCGLGYLLDDYKRRGEDSELVRRLRHKRVNR